MKPGTKVTLVRRINWFVINPEARTCPDPRFGEIYTVLKRQMCFGFDCLFFEEFGPNNAYEARFFVPVISDGELEKELTSISEPELA
jgi:hypothetical protein